MSPDVTELLIAHGTGDADAFDRLVPLVYEDLRRIARVHLRRRSGSDTLDTGGLVHEAYLRLVDQRRASWRDRGHFFAVSAMAMRQIVVDHARRRTRLKRGGDRPAVSLDDAQEPGIREAEHVLEIDVALKKLAAIDPRLARVVECRYDAVLAEAAREDDFLQPGGALSGSLGDEIRTALTGADDARDEIATSPALESGFRIEHYEIIGLIGRGGMGEVYRARDLRLGRDVALKILPARFARDAERIARFRREARVLASLSHPGIGAIHGVAAERDLEALVLELVDGPTLADRLEEGALSIDESLAIGRRLAEAIEAAHGRGILHRDLKPANIKLTPDGGVKVLDFGLARILAPDDSAATRSCLRRIRGACCSA